MYFRFVRYRKIFYIFSIILTVLSLVGILAIGLKWGIDFTGGSLLSFSYQGATPEQGLITDKLKEIGLSEISLQREGNNRYLLKTKSIDESKHQEALTALRSLGTLDEGALSFQSFGPDVGMELRNKTQVVVILSLLGILIYIAFSFRKVSRPVKSYIYGLTGSLALMHDVLIPLGVFVVLGQVYGAEVTIPIVTGLLTVFGYSINDSVVVFDRVRENLLKARGTDFEVIIDDSLNQTLGRSFSTSFTVLLALVGIFLFGGESLRYFSLALILGIGFGTYSSIFVATLLLFTFYRWQEKRKGIVV